MMELSWKRNLYVLWIGVFLTSMAFTISIPFLPLFLNQSLGISEHLEAWAGVVFGITFLMSAAIAPFWGSLSDKYGRKPMVLRSGISLGVLYLLTYFVENPYQLLVIRVLQGLLAGYVPSSMALIATNTPDRHVGYALGVMSTAGAAGGIIGPLVGGVVTRYIGFREAFLFSGVLVLLAALIAWIGAKEENFNRNRKPSRVIDDLREAAGNRPLLRILLFVLFISSSVMVFEPLMTLYVLELGSTAQTASLHSGLIFSAVGIATIVAAPYWGRLGQRIGYRKTLYIGLLGGGLGNLLQFGVHNLFWFGALRFVYGIFFSAVYPSLNALIVRATSPDFRGRAFSLNQSASQLGNVVGPVAGGLLGGWLAIPLIFAMVGVSMAASALAVKLWKPRSGSTARDQQSVTGL